MLLLLWKLLPWTFIQLGRMLNWCWMSSIKHSTHYVVQLTSFLTAAFSLWQKYLPQKLLNFTSKLLFVLCVCLIGDPFEQKNLYDTRPDIVRRLMSRIDHWRRQRAKAVYRPNSADNISDGTTFSIGNQTVQRIGYCSPKTDFPLTHVRDADCYPNK